MRSTTSLLATYLGAIVAANGLIAWGGPSWLGVTALVFIPLDLVVRDGLHERWHGHHLARRMAALILTGGLLTWLVTPGARVVAGASTVAFVAGATADALGYAAAAWAGYRRPARRLWSNVAGALVDTVVFVALAFPAAWTLPLVGSQWGQKVLASVGWTLVLERWLTHRRARVAVSVFPVRPHGRPHPALGAGPMRKRGPHAR